MIRSHSSSVISAVGLGCCSAPALLKAFAIADLEDVQVVVEPAHHDLNRMVQIEQRQVGGHAQAPPDPRLHSLEVQVEIDRSRAAA